MSIKSGCLVQYFHYLGAFCCTNLLLLNLLLLVMNNNLDRLLMQASQTVINLKPRCFEGNYSTPNENKINLHGARIWKSSRTCSPLSDINFLSGGRIVITSGRYMSPMLQGSYNRKKTPFQGLAVHHCCIQHPALQDQAERYLHGNRGVHQSPGSSSLEKRWRLVAELSEEAHADVCFETWLVQMYLLR